MKICPVGAVLFHVDSQTERLTQTDKLTDRHDKENSHFLQFCKCV